MDTKRRTKKMLSFMGITTDIEFDYFISIELEKLTSFALGSFRVFFVFVVFFFILD